jgi:tRNA-2-methylthio-N6-dimethylallyladenosine synthase
MSNTLKKKVYIKTFGCQMNEADSERMLALLERDNYQATGDANEADLIIVNTCSVREKAHQKAISEVGKHNKTGKRVKIGVTGCVASQEKSALVDRFKEVDFVLGTDHIDKIRLAARYSRLQDGAYVAADFHEIADYHFPETAISTSRQMVKAYVTIMKGCDNKCSFCIVPFTRGPEISRDPEDIIMEIKAFEGRGVREITLLGQNVNSYGKGLPNRIDFSSLLGLIGRETDIWRLRYTSPHPKDLSQGLIDEYQNNRILCRHIHLPVQSGCSRILKRMQRAHTRETYLRRVMALREACPDVAISTDIIVGFPGETDADFQETLSLMREVQYDSSYSFVYSERPGTEAANFDDDVNPEIKSDRLQEIQALQQELSYKKNQNFINNNVEVLVEGQGKANEIQMTGRSICNRVVNFDGSMSDIGAIVNAKVTRATAYALYGEKVDE